MEKEILNYLKADLKCSEKVAANNLKRLSQFKDIFDEFCYWFANKKFVNKKAALKVEGYSAEELHDKFPIFEVGAFNLLVSLRTNRETTLDYINKGLPLY